MSFCFPLSRGLMPPRVGVLILNFAYCVVFNKFFKKVFGEIGFFCAYPHFADGVALAVLGNYAATTFLNGKFCSFFEYLAEFRYVFSTVFIKLFHCKLLRAVALDLFLYLYYTTIPW